MVQELFRVLIFAHIRTSLSPEIRSTPYCKCDSYTRMTANDANESTQRLVEDGMMTGLTNMHTAREFFVRDRSKAMHYLFCITSAKLSYTTLLPPPGFRPEGGNSRRHPSSSRVYIEVLTVQNIQSVTTTTTKILLYPKQNIIVIYKLLN